MAQNPAGRKLTIIACVLAVLTSITVFSYRNQQGFYQTPIDFLIFLRTNQLHNETGQLYKRVDNYADKYHPSAAIYKFPPAFQFMIAPLAKYTGNINFHLFTRLLLTGMYISSLLLLFIYLRKSLQLDRTQRFYFGSLLTIIACWLMPFFECIRWLLAEIPLLLLLIISFLLLTKNRTMAAISGAIMAYVACAKIYPVFIFGYHLVQKSRAAIVGFIIGLVITLSAAVSVYGLPEHLFYLQNILPVLMREEVTDKWINLNLEKFLFITATIPEITGNIFQLTRLFFVGGLAYMLYIYRNKLATQEFPVFALFVTTMFFCFPNYWPQYQIFLIIPIAFLIAHYLKTGHNSALVFLMATVSLLFLPDVLWENIMHWDAQRKGLDLEILAKEAYRNGTGITLITYSPLTWLTYYLYEARALVPVVLWFMQLSQLRRSQMRS